jgi:hypothetical protein
VLFLQKCSLFEKNSIFVNLKLYTMEKHINAIQSLNAELQANKGIVPDSWKPYLPFFVMALQIARSFVPDKEKAIIDILIAAITAAEA